MAAFQFGECLESEVVMKKLRAANGGNVTAAFLPAFGRRYEIVRGCQLDVEIEAVLQQGDGFKNTFRLGIQFNVYIKSLVTKSQQEGSCATGEVHITGRSGCGGKFLH